jgi:hypothetical protein
MSIKKHVDVFPAIIKLAPPGSLENITDMNILGDVPPGTRKLDRCRVVIINETMSIAVDSPEGPKLVFRERVTEVVHEGKTTYALTESGKITVFTKDDNCGCGSRLRGWNPYGNVVMSTENPT